MTPLPFLQVVDEADRILEIGFEEEMRQIIKILPKDRQTMLFSATQTTKVQGWVTGRAAGLIGDGQASRKECEAWPIGPGFVENAGMKA